MVVQFHHYHCIKIKRKGRLKKKMSFRRWCRKTRRIRRKIHVAGVKCFTFINAVSLLFWITYADAICSWQPYLIMSINFCWLTLMAYANQGSVKEERDCYDGKM